MTLRTISIVNRYELKTHGCCHRDAIAFGDVDNDGANELVVGTYSGHLFIFKAGSGKPWRRAAGLGVVAALAVGDIFNVGRNSLVVVSAEGVCSIFDDIKGLDKHGRRDGAGGKNSHAQGRLSAGDDQLKPVYVQRIQANVRSALLVDATGDGRLELILSLTDRVVRTYRWTPPSYRQSSESSETSSSVSTSAGSSASVANGGCGSVSGSAGVAIAGSAGESTAVGSVGVEATDGSAAEPKQPEVPTWSGHLAGIHKWDLGSHLNSISVHHEPDPTSSPSSSFSFPETTGAAALAGNVGAESGTPAGRAPCPADQVYLLLAQPGGDVLRFSFRAAGTRGVSSCSSLSGAGVAESDLVFQLMPAPPRIKNRHISCVVLGDILMPSAAGGSQVLCYCIATLDGTIILFQNNREKWHLNVEDELFAVSKLDVTGDGFDEIVACGWSGNTYIVNHKKECVRFVLDEPANNFVAGRFGPTHAPCFVYGTFRNRLVVYPKIRLPPLQPRTLTDQLQQPQWSEVREKLSRFLSSRSRSAEAGGGETTPEADASRDLAHSLRRLSIPLPQHSNPPSPGSAADAFHSSYPSLFPQISRLASRPVIDPRKAHETAELVRHLLYGRRSRRLRSKGRRSAARTAAQHQ